MLIVKIEFQLKTTELKWQLVSPSHCLAKAKEKQAFIFLLQCYRNFSPQVVPTGYSYWMCAPAITCHVCKVTNSGVMRDCDPNSDEARTQVDSYCHRVCNIKIAVRQFFSKTYKRSLFSAAKALGLRRVRREMHRKFEITWNGLLGTNKINFVCFCTKRNEFWLV